MIMYMLNGFPLIAFGACLVIVFQLLVRLGDHLLDRDSPERRWSRQQRAARRERARLQKKGTR